MHTIPLDKNKRAGLIGTILFHLLLLLAFMFYGLQYQYPPPEQGILINFGTSNEGTGEIQPEESGEPVAVNQENKTGEPQKSEEANSQEKILTQEKIETIEIPKQKEKKKNKKSEEKKTEEEKPKISEELSAALNKLKNKNKNKTSEGETGNAGDQGDPEGSKTATSYEGGPYEGGVAYNMKGRKMLIKPRVKEKSQEEGKVVVDLIVDRDGNVIRAKAGAKGTTYTQNPALWKRLEEESMKIKFSPSNNPYTPEEQRGTVTYVFILE